MNNAERRFKEFIKRKIEDPRAYIRKVPDKRQTGHGGGTGLPDYLVVSKGKTTWYEVKQSPTKTTFNLNLISESQWIEFTRMSFAQASIFIAAYVNEHLYIIPYKLLKIIQAEGETSVDLDFLEMWEA